GGLGPRPGPPAEVHRLIVPVASIDQIEVDRAGARHHRSSGSIQASPSTRNTSQLSNTAHSAPRPSYRDGIPLRSARVDGTGRVDLSLTLVRCTATWRTLDCRSDERQQFGRAEFRGRWT